MSDSSRERKPGKRELSRLVKDNAAALLESFDLGQLIGDELHSEIMDDFYLCEFVETRRDAIAERIRRM